MIYTAHWDHLGIGPAVNGDRIYNGAKDNAAGVAGLIEIARAFTKLPTPPRRSILFLSVTAEEQGLLGSQYYSIAPIYPLAKTLADINMDGMNVHGRTKDLTLVGYGASDLDDYARDAAGEQGRLDHGPTPSRRRASTTDPITSTSRSRACPRSIPTRAWTSSASRRATAQKLRDEFTERDYHKPSDQVRARLGSERRARGSRGVLRGRLPGCAGRQVP